LQIEIFDPPGVKTERARYNAEKVHHYKKSAKGKGVIGGSQRGKKTRSTSERQKQTRASERSSV